MDRPLTSALGSGMTPASAACLDAETLAAWADKALPDSTMAAVDTHLADCARCQAMLAAFVSTEPAHPAAETQWWSRWQVRWLAPLAAGAALLLWAVMPRQAAPAPAATMTRVEERSSPDLSRSDAPAVPEPPPPPQAPAAPPAPRPAQAAPPMLLPSTPATAPPPPRPAQAAGRAAIAPFADRSENRTAAMEAVAAPPTLGVMSRAAPRGVIAFDALPIRWRIVSNTRVERSSNGSPWEPVPIDGPVHLVAGAAPSADVCWLVGRGGMVLRWTDRGPFARRPFPDATDLSAVQAVDDRQASVTTADGRVFSTDDGGLTWIRIP